MLPENRSIAISQQNTHRSRFQLEQVRLSRAPVTTDSCKQTCQTPVPPNTCKLECHSGSPFTEMQEDIPQALVERQHTEQKASSR